VEAEARGQSELPILHKIQFFHSTTAFFYFLSLSVFINGNNNFVCPTRADSEGQLGG